jgi:hypothetical protein
MRLTAPRLSDPSLPNAEVILGAPRSPGSHRGAQVGAVTSVGDLLPDSRARVTIRHDW